MFKHSFRTAFRNVCAGNTIANNPHWETFSLVILDNSAKLYSVCSIKCYFPLTSGKQDFFFFFSQESRKGKGILHTWKTVWLCFSNKQNDLLVEVRIMQYSKSWGWILFPVKWSMERGNLCLHSVHWECIHVQAIAQLLANRSQSPLWTSSAAFKERSSTKWTKWLATSFLLSHH